MYLLNNNYYNFSNVLIIVFFGFFVLPELTHTQLEPIVIILDSWVSEKINYTLYWHVSWWVNGDIRNIFMIYKGF